MRLLHVVKISSIQNQSVGREAGSDTVCGRSAGSPVVYNKGGMKPEIKLTLF